MTHPISILIKVYELLSNREEERYSGTKILYNLPKRFSHEHIPKNTSEHDQCLHEELSHLTRNGLSLVRLDSYVLLLQVWYRRRE